MKPLGRAVTFVLALVASACSAPYPTTPPAAESTASTAADREPPAMPAAFEPLWKQAVSEGSPSNFRAFTYQYAVAGNRVAAVMKPRSIPRDDTLLVGVITDLSRRAFNADLSQATPRLVSQDAGTAIAFDTSTHTYYVLTVKNVTAEGSYGAGEPHTLLVWREAN